MHADSFISQLNKHFPIQQPDAARLFEGIRSESGCEKLDFFVHVEWPDLTLEMLEGAAEEFWQMSSVWNRYFLPAFMHLTSKCDLEFDTYHLETGTFIEVKEEYSPLILCVSSYWFSIEWFMTERFDITKNLYYGLTTEQINLLEIWLKRTDYETLQKTGELDGTFDYSDDGINKFIEKAHQFAA